MHFSKLPAFNYEKLSNNTFDIEQFMFLVFNYNGNKNYDFDDGSEIYFIYFSYFVYLFFLNESMSENDMHAFSHIDLHPLTH